MMLMGREMSLTLTQGRPGSEAGAGGTERGFRVLRDDDVSHVTSPPRRGEKSGIWRVF